MQNLKETLESFSLSENSRRKILIEDHQFGNQASHSSFGIQGNRPDSFSRSLPGKYWKPTGNSTTHVCGVLLSRRGQGWHQRPHRISSQPQEWFSQEHLQVGHPAQPCFRNRHHVREGHPSRRCHQGIPADT